MNACSWIRKNSRGSTATSGSRPGPGPLAVGLWALTMSVWVLIVLVAIVLAQSASGRRQPQAWKAAHALVPNHHLTVSDLQAANLTGYVRRPIEQGKTISTDDLVGTPSLTPPSGLLVVLLPLAKGTSSDQVDPGKGAQVCLAGKPLPKPLKVQAVFCAPAEPCLAAILVPPDTQAMLKPGATVQPAPNAGAQATCG